MPSLQVAHVREQGVDLIIAPLDYTFGCRTPAEQQAAIREIQVRSSVAGLAGTVVPVWDSGGGRMGFIAPRNWHPFFRSLSLSAVWGSVNRQLSW